PLPRAPQVPSDPKPAGPHVAARVIADRLDPGEDPTKHAVVATRTSFELPALARCHNFCPPVDQLRRVFGMNWRLPPLPAPGRPEIPVKSCQRWFTNSLESSGSLLQAIAGMASRIARCC